eukprot:CAMPEP_0176219022 /NCGR_PEP_ID=MMETSP0121_2-20121125/18497_1 /TAXON_ID=160619 /ORGANISM="Kryptoperidinium foliaceum, Strain CCMP 1326" /LENGTH=30 /DNA_ID= /DNA_START= /DNA_END= /DNA_ORIENTATION=
MAGAAGVWPLRARLPLGGAPRLRGAARALA